MRKYRNVKYDILTVYEKSRMRSKSLALKVAAVVPQTPSQPQVRHLQTNSQIRRKDVTQRSWTRGIPSRVNLSHLSCSEPTGSLEKTVGMSRDCRYPPFPVFFVCSVPLISSPEPQTQLLQQIVLEKLCRSFRKHKISTEH